MNEISEDFRSVRDVSHDVVEISDSDSNESTSSKVDNEVDVNDGSDDDKIIDENLSLNQVNDSDQQRQQSQQSSNKRSLDQIDSQITNENGDNTIDNTNNNDTKKRKKKARTPSPPPLQVEKPLKTFRLDLDLLKSDNYIFNVLNLGVESNQLSPKLSANGPYSNLKALMDQVGESDDDPNFSYHDLTNKRKRQDFVDQYDVNDPFVDDSELIVDEPILMGKPRKEGFYVAVGDVELVTQSPPKENEKDKEKDKKKLDNLNEKDKEKSKKRVHVHNLSKYSSLFPKPQAPTDPIAPDISFEGVSIDVSAETPKKAPKEFNNDSPLTINDGGRTDITSIIGKKKGGLLTGFTMDHLPSPSWSKGKKEYPIEPITEELQTAFEQLTVLIMKENFEHKAKFPQSLKDPLKRTAEIAIQFDQYDEPHFYNRLPRLFPYNRFTMMKLTKNLIFDYHKNFYEERYELCKKAFKEDLERDWKQNVDAHAELMKLYEKELEEYNSKYPESERKAVNDGSNDNPKPMNIPLAPEPPKPRWKYTERMNIALLAMVEIQEDIHHLELEKSELDKTQPAPPREQVYRSKVYAELSSLFPTGWMHTTEISRKRTNLSLQKRHQRNQPELPSSSNGNEGKKSESEK